MLSRQEGLIDHWPAVTELADAGRLRRHLGGVTLNEDRVHLRKANITTIGDMEMAACHIIAFSNWDTPEARQLDLLVGPLFDVPDVLAHRTSPSIFLQSNRLHYSGAGCSCLRICAAFSLGRLLHFQYRRDDARRTHEPPRLLVDRARGRR